MTTHDKIFPCLAKYHTQVCEATHVALWPCRDPPIPCRDALWACRDPPNPCRDALWACRDPLIPCRDALWTRQASPLAEMHFFSRETVQNLAETRFALERPSKPQQIGLICLSARPVMTDLSLSKSGTVVTELPIGKSSSDKISSRQSR